MESEQHIGREMSIDDTANMIRTMCHDMEKTARGLVRNRDINPMMSTVTNERLAQLGEVKAQIMLGVRHLEDARMRFGKVLQYLGDGVSIYDKNGDDDMVSSAPKE